MLPNSRLPDDIEILEPEKPVEGEQEAEVKAEGEGAEGEE
jgi:hypothetical protein